MSRVVASEPATWHGTLDDDTPVTLLGVQHHPDMNPDTVIAVLIGAQIQADAHLDGIRWKIPGVVDTLTGNDTLDYAVLTGWDSYGIQADLTTPLLLSQARTLAVQITRLWEVATGNPTWPTDVEVRLIGDSDWHPYRQAGSRRRDVVSGDLVHHYEITWDQMVTWARRCRDWGPVTAMTREIDAPLELKALLAAAALEGLHNHRQQPTSPTPFLGLSPEVLDPAVDAAVTAGDAALAAAHIDPDARRTFSKRIRDQFKPKPRRPTYHDRVMELLPDVDDLAPGLLGPNLESWTRALTLVRNAQAHQSGAHDDLNAPTTFLPDLTTLYLGIQSTARWVLRISLLAEVIDHDTLRETSRAAGQGRYRAYRGLGARWTRILWRAWTDHQPYDTERHHAPKTQPDTPGQA